jgi:DnaJ-class molecular chaperone
MEGWGGSGANCPNCNGTGYTLHEVKWQCKCGSCMGTGIDQIERKMGVVKTKKKKTKVKPVHKPLDKTVQKAKKKKKK